MPYTAYVDNTDVLTEFPSLVYAASAGDGITAGQVDQWALEFSLLIDSKIACKYQVPVTGTDALSLIKMVCKELCVSKIKEKLYLAAGSKSDSQLKEATEIRKRNMDFIEMIRKGDARLPADAGEANMPTSDSYGRKYDEEPVFDKDSKQW